MLMMTAMFALVVGGGDDVAAALRIKMMMTTSPVASLPKPGKLSETLLAHLFAQDAPVINQTWERFDAVYEDGPPNTREPVLKCAKSILVRSILPSNVTHH